MKCYKCKFENVEKAKFCTQCGIRLSVICATCKMVNSGSSKFCSECGASLGYLKTKQYKRITTKPIEYLTALTGPFNGERKFITIIFSDLSDYTPLSERLDPEVIKEMMGQLFSEIAQIIIKYEGQVERIIGDSVMALFGAPKAHEDDAVRAIKAAREIHQMAEQLSPKYERQLGQALSMHTGINTGLVVTGRVSIEEGMHGVSGDTVNTASRLSDLAKSGEILVGLNTYQQAFGHYNFEKIPDIKIKGKSDPFKIYRVISPKNKPLTIHRHMGLQAMLIGRPKELQTLCSLQKDLFNGKRIIVSILGDAGTGKSRLVQEFKSKVDLKKIRWVESHAYAHTRNIPYFPFIDLINRLLKIEEGDPSDVLRDKLEKGIGEIVDAPDKVIPIIGNLYGFYTSKLKGIGPDGWRGNLQKAINSILVSLSIKGPVLYYFEDIHWTDPETLEMLKNIISGFRFPSLFLCVYRPTISLFRNSQISSMGKIYKEIFLKELSTSEAQEMMVSLLDSKRIPEKLSQFIRDRAEGNPFYLEELINSLVETGVLKKEKKQWILSNTFVESDIPPTIHGVIAARLDRLEHKSKRILQEASVFGRAFLFDILKRVSSIRDEIDRRFNDLERIDLVRKRSIHPDLEFVFKHTLTQEVGYNSLLKKERKQIHESIAHVMEDLFQDRLSEFYEALANHYKKGYSIEKAVHYLSKSGQKSLQHYALEQSHQFFKDAYTLINEQKKEFKDVEVLLLRILNQWAFAYYYRGDSNGLLSRLKRHQPMAETIPDSPEKAMYYAWLGRILWTQECFHEAYEHLKNALDISEKIDARSVQCYASTWLIWVCAEIGHLKEGIDYAENAQNLYQSHCSDEHFIYFDSKGALGFVLWLMGERKKVFDIGLELIEFGHQHANLRSMVLGYCCQGWSYHIDKDFENAVTSLVQAIQISVDPWYTQFSRLSLCFIYYYMGNDDKTREQTAHLSQSFEQSGAAFIGTPVRFLEKLYTIIENKNYDEIYTIEAEVNGVKEKGSILRYALLRFSVSRFYLSIAQTISETDLPHKRLPEIYHLFQNGLSDLSNVAEKCGALGIFRQCHLYLGEFYLKQGQKEKAREHLSIVTTHLKENDSPHLFALAQNALSRI